MYNPVDRHVMIVHNQDLLESPLDQVAQERAFHARAARDAGLGIGSTSGSIEGDDDQHRRHCEWYENAQSTGTLQPMQPVVIDKLL